MVSTKVFNPMKKQYYCPHCKSSKIIEYEDSFDCPFCRLEFEKEDFDHIKDKSNILALEEKQGISEVFREIYDER